MDLGTSNIAFIVCLGALAGFIAAAEIKGRPAIPMPVLMAVGILGMGLGDALIGSVVNQDPSHLFPLRHTAQMLVAAGCLLLVVAAGRRRARTAGSLA